MYLLSSKLYLHMLLLPYVCCHSSVSSVQVDNNIETSTYTVTADTYAVSNKRIDSTTNIPNTSTFTPDTTTNLSTTMDAHTTAEPGNFCAYILPITDGQCLVVRITCFVVIFILIVVSCILTHCYCRRLKRKKTNRKIEQRMTGTLEANTRANTLYQALPDIATLVGRNQGRRPSVTSEDEPEYQVPCNTRNPFKPESNTFLNLCESHRPLPVLPPKIEEKKQTYSGNSGDYVHAKEIEEIATQDQMIDLLIKTLQKQEESRKTLLPSKPKKSQQFPKTNDVNNANIISAEDFMDIVQSHREDINKSDEAVVTTVKIWSTVRRKKAVDLWNLDSTDGPDDNIIPIEGKPKSPKMHYPAEPSDACNATMHGNTPESPKPLLKPKPKIISQEPLAVVKNEQEKVSTSYIPMNQNTHENESDNVYPILEKDMTNKDHGSPINADFSSEMNMESVGIDNPYTSDSTTGYINCHSNIIATLRGEVSRPMYSTIGRKKPVAAPRKKQYTS